jgi:TM2 domain-containing membrane protein YozV
MASEWYYSRHGERHGPISTGELKDLAAAGKLLPDDLVWKEGMENWTAAGKVKGLLPGAGAAAVIEPAPSTRAPTSDHRPSAAPSGDLSNRQLAVGLAALVGGALGLHKFILGDNMTGLIRLVVSLATFGVGWAILTIIGMIEGVIYLRMSAEEFHETYVVGKKSWF